ncbi:Rv3235 family protein [Brachybacterium huguangmaarense]|uniref:Rv3235 family protein n=1 Tax=Brachybacterium huguangmaarense TaxID=1652028 RepID=A0ABY6FXR1_9MICO|nr:Rv3235 family protein [Brachybacterium huguangmaarense]UYG15719.1 Rv3235 family protein [Brachybacterium huguangmaarense]
MTATDQRPVAADTSGVPLPLEDPRTAERMVESVARFAVEIIRDQRPVATLSRLVTPEITTMLERRAHLTRRLRATSASAVRALPSRVVLRGVRTCVVNETTVEASAVLLETGRARFIAMRWELRPRGWKVTVLEIG